MVGFFERFYAFSGKRTGTECDEETPNHTVVLDVTTGNAECRERSVVLQRVDRCLWDKKESLRFFHGIHSPFPLPGVWLSFPRMRGMQRRRSLCIVHACALIFHCIPSQLILSPSVLPLPIPKDCSCEWRRVMSPLLTHKFTYESKKGEESARFSLYVLSCEGHSACLPLSPSDY